MQSPSLFLSKSVELISWREGANYIANVSYDFPLLTTASQARQSSTVPTAFIDRASAPTWLVS
jgi:hypothetical protein